MLGRQAHTTQSVRIASYCVRYLNNEWTVAAQRPSGLGVKHLKTEAAFRSDETNM
jgi:hypothetical protein